MKKIVLMILTLLMFGCATPMQRAEKLAEEIEKDTPSSVVSQTLSPSHCFLSSVGDAVSLPFVLMGKGASDMGKRIAGFLSLPLALLQIPGQMAADGFRCLEKVGELFFK